MHPTDPTAGRQPTSRRRNTARRPLDSDLSFPGHHADPRLKTTHHPHGPQAGSLDRLHAVAQVAAMVGV